MKANPKASRPARELGYYYYKKDNLEEAEKWLSKAARMNSLDVSAFHYLGEIYLKVEDIEKASHYFEKAMNISPRQIDRGIHFAKTLMQKKMIKEAIGVFGKILMLPGSGPELQEEIADYCIESGVEEYGVQILESLIDENKSRWDLYHKIGKVLEKSGDTIRAATYFTQGAELNKEHAEIRIDLAKIYLALRKPILAEKPLVEILEIDRDHEEARKLLKRCY
jgi:Tfp pilus assembly protein PilF